MSLTIGEDNLLWLKGRAGHKDGNLSAAVDQLITDARAGRVGSSAPARSVVGTIHLAADNPELQGADDVMRELFAASVARPSIARESSPPYGASARRRKAKPRRG